MIRLENINKTFFKKKKEIQALKNISLHIQKKDIYGIIGYSGSGKSTLVRTINLLERPESGAVYVFNDNLINLDEKGLISYRQKIGMIFQHFNLLSSRTIFENIAFPLQLTSMNTEAIKTKVESLLALVGLADRHDDYPSSLSGGQKQRVAIARALASDPQILLCDEATSALDPQTTRSILSLLKKINQEMDITIVLITHQMEVVRAICNKVAVISDGEIIESNTVENLFSSPLSPITKDLLNPSLIID
ncbi:ATP-binding cassette domain-containing protein [Sphingobacterium sp. UT-1RO-CII-1]|uniref:methionine ABC transporter ATP-binding protein n=1 Tax=Sphingobacterium sp. UT-1RO-CII-1 TaxID=2995225 RepID=UPI00227AFDE3|nr:ATP-binding cassette domain-containing protein [Sphingobacterium sp. UT-1RO-CII-1]MCY4779329.1 ATP-binding cassette domain-containing protein [Sphingobacterium sp. UT-1RO-CII-1]